MKTRQQRRAEERAGHPSSPPQQLPVKTRGPRRTRAKQPSVGETSTSSPAPVAGSGQVTVAAGALAPAAQLAVPGEAQALLRLWVDVSPEVVASGRPVNGPTIELAIPSAEVADFLAFIESLRQAESQRQQTPTRSNSAPPQSPKIDKPIYTMSEMSPRTTPTRIEPALQHTAPPVRSPNINKVINRMSHSVLGQTANKKSTHQSVPSSRETPNTANISAMSRNRSLPVTYSADGAALYGNVITTTNASGVNASFDDREVYQQFDDAASINGDSNMEDVSDSDISPSNLVESYLQEATQSTLARSPETPRGSGWGLGHLFQSAHYSIARRFGFSPLSPISERSEPSPQTQTVKIAQMQTENTISKQSKEKNSVPTSARAIRARNRRHNDSFAETGKSITIGQNQRDQNSLAKKASAASRSPEATVTEDENAPAKRPIHRNQVEAQKTQTPEPDMTPIIRFPSQFLDRTLASKRKRWGSPDPAPNPMDKSYGLDEAESYGSSEEDVVTEQQPGKLRRTSKSADFSSQAAGNPDTARPYTGSVYEKSTVEYKGGNVFSEYYAFRKAEEAGAKKTNISQQCSAKTPIPITNSAGTFKVPSPGDSDWSSSESEEEEEEMHTTGFEDVSPSRTNNGEHGLALPALRRSEPPKPQQIMKAVAESEALRRARDKALKHKPRYPSSLGRSSMTCSSPPASNEAGTRAAKPSTDSKPGPTGRPIYDAYEKWCKTASTAVTAAVERMEVDPNVAGNAFEEALTTAGPAGRATFNAYEEWCKTASPAVLAVLGMMVVDANLAGDAFKGGLSDFAASAKGAEQVVG